MNLLKITSDRVSGVISIIIGMICILEFRRLFPLRNSLLVGDHVLLGLTGAALIILGTTLFFNKSKQLKVVLPEKTMMLKLMGSL
ncbi:MAG: tripartite tricarboxylate transporter family receptor [Clostridiales bacterium]|nr:tripartite tricarboxylate transporter family receptor [Clostridiales bacterium]